jgi:hypothetical protein
MARGIGAPQYGQCRVFTEQSVRFFKLTPLV